MLQGREFTGAVWDVSGQNVRHGGRNGRSNLLLTLVLVGANLRGVWAPAPQGSRDGTPEVRSVARRLTYGRWLALKHCSVILDGCIVIRRAPRWSYIGPSGPRPGLTASGRLPSLGSK